MKSTSPFSWFESLPIEWQERKTRYLFSITKQQVEHKDQQILSITQQGVKPKETRVFEGQMAQNYDGYQILRHGDFAMNSMDLLTGWVDQSKFDGLTSPDYRVFRASDLATIDARYFLYVFQLLYLRRVYYRFGQGVSNKGRWRLPASVFRNIPLPLPQKDEQAKIVCFLDEKTAEIEISVEQLKRQIELLEKYRRELIAHAVTRGLDDSAPMRDSDIPWTPKIPGHWETARGKQVFTKLQRAVPEGAESVTCYRDGTVTLRKNRRAEGYTESLKEIGYQGVEPGDLVIHEMDAFAGAIGVSDSSGKSTPVYAVCSLKNKGNAFYYAYLLRYMADRGFILALAKGVRQRTVDFRFKTLASLTFPVPPPQEQKEIAEFLQKKSVEIDTAIANIRKQIELLATYRKQLINDVVTGKIRVGELS